MSRLRQKLRSLGIKRGDMIVVSVLLLLSAMIGILFAVNQPEPKYASVRVDGMEITRLPLDRDCIYRITDGNTIQISGGAVRMIDADCPDKICVKTGAVSRSGQSIVCAPHKIVVTVTGGKATSDYDVKTN